MGERTQKANIAQQFEMGRVLLSILPKFHLTTDEALWLIENPGKLEEILDSVLRTYLGIVDIPRLKEALKSSPRWKKILMREEQTAESCVQFRVASVLLSIIPHLNLTAGEVEDQIRQTKMLGEILGSVFQACPGDKEISHLKNALGLEFSLRVRKYLEGGGYKIVDSPRIPIYGYRLSEELEREAGGRILLEEDERFERIFHLAREVAWMPNDPFIPGTINEWEPEQKPILDRFSESIQEVTQGWAEAIFPNFEMVAHLLKTHSLDTGEFVLSTLLTRVYNRWGRQFDPGLVVGMYTDQKKGPLVDLRNLFVREDNLGVLRVIVPC